MNQKNVKSHQEALDILLESRHQAEEMAETITHYAQEVRTEADHLLSQESGMNSREISEDDASWLCATLL